MHVSNLSPMGLILLLGFSVGLSFADHNNNVQIKLNLSVYEENDCQRSVSEVQIHANSNNNDPEDNSIRKVVVGEKHNFNTVIQGKSFIVHGDKGNCTLDLYNVTKPMPNDGHKKNHLNYDTVRSIQGSCFDNRNSEDQQAVDLFSSMGGHCTK